MITHFHTGDASVSVGDQSRQHGIINNLKVALQRSGIDLGEIRLGRPFGEMKIDRRIEGRPFQAEHLENIFVIIQCVDLHEGIGPRIVSGKILKRYGPSTLRHPVSPAEINRSEGQRLTSPGDGRTAHRPLSAPHRILQTLPGLQHLVVDLTVAVFSNATGFQQEHFLSLPRKFDAHHDADGAGSDNDIVECFAGIWQINPIEVSVRHVLPMLDWFECRRCFP